MTISDRLLTLAKADRTTAGVFASMIEAADPEGRVKLNDLAILVRDQYLAMLRDEGRDAEQEAGRLSLDEVRGFLLASVLPRMAEEGLVTPPPPGTTDPDAFVALAPAVWSGVGVVSGDRTGRTSLAKAIRESGGHPKGGAVRESGSGPRPPEPDIGTGSLLEAQGLVKVYRRRKVVNDVAVRLRQGEIVGMLGPNGAGKTTTFYMIVGLIQPLEGRILLDGDDITQMPMYRRARQGIGYLSQEPSIFRKLTVEENILAILEMLPLSNTDRKARLEQLLDELSIKHLRHNKAYSLSGGERRRLEITRALVTSPKFMMLDEPFAGVDPIAVHDIQTIVAGLRHRGIGVLISDHNVEQTLDIVDRAYIMFDGQVKVSGTVRQLVFDETVAEIYLGPTLTARLRARYSAA
jgi:lipopolysaccharide export system ATP-binding protein